jgi:hypothetical protein
MSEANGHREQLEQRANEVRSKLERRLNLIDERRHRVVDLARAAARPPTSFVLLAAAGAVAALFLFQRVRARRSPVERLLRLLERANQPEASPLVQNIKKATSSLAVLAVQRAGKRGLDRWLAEPAQVKASSR